MPVAIVTTIYFGKSLIILDEHFNHYILLNKRGRNMKKLLLVDGNSIMNRTFYGIPLLTNKDGDYTNAIYGFINIITRIIDEEKASHIIVAFDLKGPTFRHEIFKDYKGTRKSMPDELRPQMVMVKEVLKTMNIAICEKKGFEADDVLGTLSRLGEEQGYDVSLLSGDRDMLQLATDKVKIIIPKTKGGKTTYVHYYADDMMSLYGITPTEFIDVKGLMGDSSDNIPGIPGVGEKTALKLITKYHTIEAAYEDRETFAKGLKAKVTEHIELALLSRKLATIILDCDIDVTIDTSLTDNMYTKSAFDFFVRLNLNSLLKRFDSAKIKEEPTYDIVKITQIATAKMHMIGATHCYYHLFYDESLVGLTYTFDEEIYYYMDDQTLKSSDIYEFVRELIQDDSIIKVTHDYKLQLHQINASLKVSALSIKDISLMMYLINPVVGHYEIDKIASEYATIFYISDEEFLGKGKSRKVYTDFEEEDRMKRHIRGLHVIKEAYPAVKKSMTDTKLDRLYDTIELPLLYVLYRIEKRGIKADGEQLKAFSESLKVTIDQLEIDIHEMAGESFNIASPKQLGIILFEKLELPFSKKTKTGYSTAVDILEKIKPYHPIIASIISYRQLTKLKSTYADGLIDYIEEDNRIHSTFNQRVTSTGRISSTEPNLQNIPIRTELGRKLRKVFIPKDGYVFIDADYSQIELRLLAHMSGDASFIKAFKEELDIHKMTASQVFHIPFDEVTDTQRRNAKAVNFGIVYGISAFGLSQDLNIGVKEAAAYIEQYFDKYPKVKEFLDTCIEGAKTKGYVTTMYGRIRPIPELQSSNHMTRSFGERVAMNTPIQGSAADVIKIAMINVENRLNKENLLARLILQVHDELIIEAPLKEQAYVKTLLVEEMEQAVLISVPLTVDAHIGNNWYEAK